MKKLFFTVFICLCSGVSGAQDGGIDYEKSDDVDTSYALGVLFGLNLNEIKSQLSMDFDYSAFLRGLGDFQKENAKISPEDAEILVQAAFELRFEQLKTENLQKSLDFLAQNAKKKGVKTTKSGLQYEVITAGKGKKVENDDAVVVVNYTGTLIDGTEFDSSYKNGEPAAIPLGRVIEGWAEGLKLMNTGSRFKLFIPPGLAYGEQGAGDRIPPNSVIIFDIELLEIEE